MDALENRIIAKSKYRRIPKNVLLLKEGEKCETFVFMKKGIVRHSFTDIDGNDITKNFIVGPSYFFYSLSSFISKTDSSIQCKTITEVELYEMPLDVFNAMLKEKAFLELWNGHLSNYILKKEIKEISFMKDSALKRYQMFLEDFPSLLNQIPHYYIASYLSVSPETLSRIRKSIS